MPPEKILRIATRQKILLTCFAGLVLLTVLGLWTQTPAFNDFWIPVFIIYEILAITTVIYAILLLNEVADNVIIAVLAALILFVPCLNLLMLMAINLQATKVLKENGVPVGFSGADIKSLKRRFRT